MDSGETFIEYESWIADDGAWCKRTVEGMPGEAVADTQLTQCGSPDGAFEVYLPSENEILRLRPGARARTSRSAQTRPRGGSKGRATQGARASGRSDRRRVVVKGKGKYHKVRTVGAEAPSLEIPSASWFNEDIVEAFRRDAVREAGTMTLDGREYTKLVTEDGLNAVIVDPDTGSLSRGSRAPRPSASRRRSSERGRPCPTTRRPAATSRSPSCIRTRPSATSRRLSSRRRSSRGIRAADAATGGAGRGSLRQTCRLVAGRDAAGSDEASFHVDVVEHGQTEMSGPVSWPSSNTMEIDSTSFPGCRRVRRRSRKRR